MDLSDIAVPVHSRADTAEGRDLYKIFAPALLAFAVNEMVNGRTSYPLWIAILAIVVLHVLSYGVPGATAFMIFVLMLPVGFRILLGYCLTGTRLSARLRAMIEDPIGPWMETYLCLCAFVCYCVYLRQEWRTSWGAFMIFPSIPFMVPWSVLSGLVAITSRKHLRLAFWGCLDCRVNRPLRIKPGAIQLACACCATIASFWCLYVGSAHIKERGLSDSKSLGALFGVMPVWAFVLYRLVEFMDEKAEWLAMTGHLDALETRREQTERQDEAIRRVLSNLAYRYHEPPSAPALLATDDHVALLVASRSPRASHAALASVNRLLARTVLSPAGAATLRRERLASGWCDAPEAAPRYVFPLDSLSQGVLDDPNPGYLLNCQQVPNCASLGIPILFILLFHREANRRGQTMRDLDDAGLRAALLESCFVPLCRVFYCEKIFALVPHEYSTTTAAGGSQPWGLGGNGGGGFLDHVEHARRVIDYAIECYDAADTETPGTMSFYAKRMVEVGLLAEFYDERSGRWKVGGDGDLMRSLQVAWAEVGDKSGWSVHCPLDASLLVVLAFMLCFRDRAALRILFRATDADDETIDDRAMVRALFRTLDHTDEAIVRGGYLLLMVVPNAQGTYRLGNYLELYVGLLKQGMQYNGPYKQLFLPNLFSAALGSE